MSVTDVPLLKPHCAVFFTAVILFALRPAGIIAAQDRQPVDFGREIRPLLSDLCFQCHGPDEQHREADLRLDTPEGLAGQIAGRRTTAPGKPDDSELLRRLTTDDPDERMPPASTGKSLTPGQIALIRRWIEQGAEWKSHWAFLTPQKPEMPAGLDPQQEPHSIDRLVRTRLQREELSPSPPADRRTLLRRMTFDLTGLPPTPDELQAFLTDESPEAISRVIDRLLASPRYAERMAIRWLEAARYADTNGYQSDGPRDMWRWRDWVIEAFQRNQPFDEFTIEQLAGDLLPNPTLAQLIATGFNRNHRGNSEGGIVPEEFQVEYVVDRVDTTFTIWQGLTMGCGRCHSHKYDPITQAEYYQVFALFNNIPENGRAIKEGNSPPFIPAPTRDQQRQLQELEERLHAARERVQKIEVDLPRRIAEWLPSLSGPIPDWKPDDALIVHLALDGHLKNTPAAAEGETQRSATTVPLATERSDELAAYEPHFVPVAESSRSEREDKPGSVFTTGPAGQAVTLDGTQTIDAGPVGRLGYFEQFSFSAWIRQEKHQAGSILSKMEPVPRGAGYSFDVTDGGTLQLNLVKRWLDDSLRVESIEPIPAGRWVHVAVTYDGTRVANGIQFFVDGRPVPLKANLDFINQTFAVQEPLRIGTGQALFRGQIGDVRIYRRHLLPSEVMVLAEQKSLANITQAPPDQRSPAQTEKLRQFFLEAAGPEEVRSAWQELKRLERDRERFQRQLPTVMVMQETQPRETHVLIRGQYDQPGAKVEPGVPACLPPLPPGVAANRLTFARWLVSRENPLTARVIVNRFWRDLFGTGLVKTTEDFGVQGERPVHPELLDWLAVEFIESGWNVKHLLKTIMTSRTYQQSSVVNAVQAERDPENRLLARGPRFRLPAEMIRDQALFVSGLLHERLGGPSVKPYQPDGLWAELATDTLYEQSHGPDLYRRSLYTYWKRTVLPPMLTGFDAPSRETCEVRQTRTNTPLQALNLLNDVTFVEAARALAQRTLTAKLPDDAARLRAMMERVLSRMPEDNETQLLLNSLNRHRTRFQQQPATAGQLLSVGEAPRESALPDTELAAWTLVASTILNLDEAVTRE